MFHSKKVNVMNKLNNIIVAALVAIGLSSCGSFLEEYSQNLTYAKTAQDLNELLIGNGYMENSSTSGGYFAPLSMGGYGEPNFPWIHVMDDDSEEFVAGTTSYNSSWSTPVNVLSGFFHWQDRPFKKLDGVIFEDVTWRRCYAHIAAANAIIYKAEDLRGKETNEALLNKVEGEAYFLRAGYYFLLVNIYGQPYAKATAATDSGVPLKITETVEDKYFSRTAVGPVYDQIVSDLKNAAKYLDGIQQPSIYRANQTAAYIMLSRVYLYMEQYDLAIEAANSALANGTYSILDMNNYVAGTNFTSKASPETVFSQGGYSINQIQTDDQTANMFSNMSQSYKVSADLLSKFNSTDLRPKAFFKATTINKVLQSAKQVVTSTTQVQNLVSDNFLIRIPEVYLNKAEAQAMLGQDNNAKETLQLLRAKRFKTADLTPISESGASLVDFVRDERRREFCFEGQRWFDLRRYAVNSIYPLAKAIKHETYAYSGSTNYIAGYYELKPYAQDKAAYIIPIPNYAITFNSGTLTNFARPERTRINY